MSTIDGNAGAEDECDKKVENLGEEQHEPTERENTAKDEVRNEKQERAHGEKNKAVQKEKSAVSSPATLSPENPLIDGIRQAIQSRHDFISWKGRWGTDFGHAFGSLLSTLRRDPRFQYQEDWPQFCPSMNSKQPSEYVMLASFDDNWYGRPEPARLPICSPALQPMPEHARMQGFIVDICAQSDRPLANGMPFRRERELYERSAASWLH